jgi:DMSO/TMAO reductase YedYZ molybdopterin-dependent catalytic subunit
VDEPAAGADALAARRRDGRLPAGQREIADFPRFGLTPFALRFPRRLQNATLRISGDVEQELELGVELLGVPRSEQVSDFHCVTTWTRRGLCWGGVRFGAFYREVVVPRAVPVARADFVVLRGQDGARTSLPLEDLLADDVLLADRLDGEPLGIAHGAPLRLVAPAHYGYKSVKHLDGIEFWQSEENYRPFGFRFMVHPRARVAREARPMDPGLAPALPVPSADTPDGGALRAHPAQLRGGAAGASGRPRAG